MIKLISKLDSHRIYESHVFSPQLSDNYLIVKSLTARYKLLIFGFLVPQKFITILDIFYFLIKMVQAPIGNTIIYREFWTPHLIFVSFFNFRKKVIYFNINHEMNKLKTAKFELRLVCFFMRKCQKLLWLEGRTDLVPIALLKYTHVIPITIAQLGFKNTPILIKIGIVGALRSEKGIESTLTEIEKLDLTKIDDDVIFEVGVPYEDMLILRHKFHRFTFRDTSNDACYHSFIASCDIIIFNFQKLDYQLRHSGVLVDAISHQCISIVPKLPLLESIVTSPKRIGVIRENAQALEISIAEAISLLRDPGMKCNWKTFFAKRKPYTQI